MVFGRVEKREENHVLKRVLRTRIPGKRKRGRPKRRLSDNIIVSERIQPDGGMSKAMSALDVLTEFQLCTSASILMLMLGGIAQTARIFIAICCTH